MSAQHRKSELVVPIERTQAIQKYSDRSAGSNQSRDVWPKVRLSTTVEFHEEDASILSELMKSRELVAGPSILKMASSTVSD